VIQLRRNGIRSRHVDSHSPRSPHFPRRRPIKPPLFSWALIFISAISNLRRACAPPKSHVEIYIPANISYRRDLDAIKVTGWEIDCRSSTWQWCRSFCSEYKIRCVRTGRELGFRGAVDVNRSPLECGTSYSYLRKQVLRTGPVIAAERIRKWPVNKNSTFSLA